MSIRYEHERMLLYKAAASPYGIVIATVELQRDLGALYAAYKADKGFLPKLEFRKSPWNPLSEIWIVKVAEAKTAEPTGGDELPPPAISDLTLGDLGL